MERRLVERSLQDDDFRSRLLADPRAAVEQELGVRLPEGMRVEAVWRRAPTPSTSSYLPPRKPASRQASSPTRSCRS
jgi:hypothetical protein